MTEHNPWKGDGSAPPAEDGVEDMEAERVPTTLNELERLPLIEQLEALNGGPMQSLGVAEMHLMLTIARWYKDRCHEVGSPPPPDIIRNWCACANEVVSYNAWLASQGHPNARPPGSTITKH